MGINDAWLAASSLIEKNGSDAAIIAARHAEQALSGGDMEGYKHWRDVAQMVEHLSRQQPSATNTR